MSTTSLMTFAEFEQLPDAPGKQELIDGELIESLPPEFRHSVIAHRYYHRLAADNANVYYGAGYRIAGGWLQPDVSVTWPDQPMLDRYLSGGPMLAIDVLSPTNTAADSQT